MVLNFELTEDDAVFRHSQGAWSRLISQATLQNFTRSALFPCAGSSLIQFAEKKRFTPSWE
jgi:hypothetical protein